MIQGQVIHTRFGETGPTSPPLPLVTLTSCVLVVLISERLVEVLSSSRIFSLHLQLCYHSSQSPRGGERERRGKAPTVDTVPTECYFIPFISASVYSQRSGWMLVWGGVDGTLTDKLNYRQLQVPPGFFVTSAKPWNQ